jgi:Domain of unknown function (DUF4135)
MLARRLTICLDQWVDVTAEFVERLCAEWDEIRAAFSSGADPGGGRGFGGPPAQRAE